MANDISNYQRIMQNIFHAPFRVYLLISEQPQKTTIMHAPAHEARDFLLALAAVLAVLNSCCKAFVSAPLPCCTLWAACKPGSPHAHAAL